MPNPKEVWWHVDKQGRRIGWLWPEDLEAILESYYGHREWVETFADRIGTTRSTVDRYRNGTVPIPKVVALVVSMFATMKNRGIATAELDGDWLPPVMGSQGKMGQGYRAPALNKLKHKKHRPGRRPTVKKKVEPDKEFHNTKHTR